MYTLITAATTSLAYKLKRQLGTENLILGDFSELPAIMMHGYEMIKLPDPASASYVHDMLTLCLDKQITALYPLKEHEKERLTEASQLFAEYEIKIVFSPLLNL